MSADQDDRKNGTNHMSDDDLENGNWDEETANELESPVDELESRLAELENRVEELESVRGVDLTIPYVLGLTIAVVLSWSRSHSILWCTMHGLFSWGYVIYFTLTG